MNKDEAEKLVRAICARKEVCRQDILQKLKQWGVSPNHREDLLASLEQDGFIDEKRYAASYCREKFRFNKWGRIKLRYMLRQKEIPELLIDAALKEIDPEEYQLVLREELSKKIRSAGSPGSAGTRKKLEYFAQQRGFEYEEINRALKELSGK